MPRPDGQISKGEPAGSSDDQVTGAHEGSQLSPLPATRDTTRLPDDGATRLGTGDATRLATGDATTLAAGDATTLATGDETRLAPSDPTRLATGDATKLTTGLETRLASRDATRLVTGDETRLDPDLTRLPDADDLTRLPDSNVGGAGDADITLLSPASDPDSETIGVRPVADDDETRYQGSSATPSPADASRGLRPPSRAGQTSRPRTSAGGGRGRSNAQGPIEVGQAFGERYHIIRVLGVGGMGAVYQAWDAELGVAVALKVIRPEITADPEAARDIERRFKRELLLARQVTHKNVVRIHDLGDIDGIKYITMPFVEGADLATILAKEHKLPLARALRIARGIVSGLISAHHAGVVHRDLKPANIMIGPDDTPTIMDFGIARSSGGPGQGPAPVAGIAPTDLSRAAALAASNTVAGTIVGTVAYMAPEQAKGQEVDQRADIYALGLIFYDMLIGGRRAERAASAVAELQERMQTAPPAPRTLDAQVPEAVDAIVKRCLEPDPAKRFQTTVELHNALERLDENGKPLPMIRRLTRRTMIAATLVVLLLLGGTYYVTRWLSAPPAEYAPVTVVVADFQNNTNDPSFDSTLAQTVRRALEDASFISAYDRTRVSALGVRAPDKLPELAARELAVKQGVGVVLAGLIQPSGNGFDLSMKATETVTGSTIASVQNRAANKDQVLATATRLVARVRKALGDKTSESAQLLAMRTLSTSSLDVLSHYAAAVEAQSKGRYEDARQSYLRAIELDPQFGLGYQGLAAISRNLGQVEASEKYIGEAVSNLDRMTARERFATRGLSYLFSGDLRLCEKEYGDLVQQFPADTVGRGQRAGCLAKLRKLPEAIAEMQEAVRMLPNHAVYRSNLALLYDLAGEFDKAEAEVRAIQEPQARALVPLAYSQLGRELLPDAVASYERIGKMGPLGASIASSGLADVAIYQGRFSSAVTLLEEGAAADLAAKNVERAAIKFTSLAYAELMAGHKDRAVAAADKALANGKAMAVRFLAARIFAEAGQLDKAKALAATLSAEAPQEPQAHGKLLEGLIALKRGNAREAIRIFTEANALLDTWFGHFDLGRAYLQDGAKLQADSEFDRCVVRRGEALSLMDEGPTFGHFPAVYYYRGRVREEMKTAGYADSYREYLKIRGASTEDPLVPDIRRRVGN